MLRAQAIADIRRIAAIGDSLETDIAGAKGAGLDAVLIAGGILTRRIPITPGQLPEAAALEAVCAEEGVRPDYVVPAFV